MSPTAFITPTNVPIHPSRSSKAARSSQVRPDKLRATATQPARTASSKHVKTSKLGGSQTRRPKTSANVIDSRVASREEAHHWITVKNHAMRLFERAAVAQADIARQLEKRSPSGGVLHRWVLRHTDNQMSSSSSTKSVNTQQGNTARYVVMESYARPTTDPTQGVDAMMTRRWLSAVERVGPLMHTVDIRSLHYDNVFTSKIHDVVFDPKRNIVVVESINVDMKDKRAMESVVNALRNVAEASVADGHCLEFCVLRSATDAGFLKTVEVYRDAHALQRHMDTVDGAFAEEVRSRTMSSERNRGVFKPVVFG